MNPTPSSSPAVSRELARLLGELNPEQRAAVLANGVILVYAGPGSGKTKTLTYRVARLVLEGVPPERILALTFTNKAAREMRERVERIHGHELPTFLGTFHAFGLRVIREERDALRLPEAFSVFDEEDSLKAVKDALKERDLPLSPDFVLETISRMKLDAKRPADLLDSSVKYEQVLGGVWEAYEKTLEKAGGLDFDDLLLKTLALFSKPDILQKYQNRFDYVLVDEYQDVNNLEYQLIRSLAAPGKDLFVVGDDAQAIYAFKGADFRNILNFKRDWPDAQVFFLNRNYRSTQTIVAAAREVIAQNVMQQPKELWTENEAGERMRVVRARDGDEEARLIAETMLRMRARHRNIAVLYRVNYLSRAIEEELIRNKIPYQIFGGFRYYQRKEVKDILAYLRVYNNPRDTVALKRIVNTPARGIGEKTQQRFFALPAEERERILTLQSPYPPFETFLSLLSDLHAYEDGTLAEFVTAILRKTRYEESLAEERVGNVMELVSLAEKYEKLPLREAVQEFLLHAALFQETDTPEESGAVKLLSLHLAKGLEFDAVWIAGLEEGILPHWKHDGDLDLEEERRLLYVGMTRAKKEVTLSFCNERAVFGKTKKQKPSRFVAELPAESVELVDATA